MKKKNIHKNEYIKSLVGKTLLKYNPALWFELFFILILFFIILINLSDFPFDSFSLFTLFWTFPLVLIIHYILSFKTIHSLEKKFTTIQFLKWLKVLTVFYLPYLIMAIIYENLVFIIDIIGNTSINYDNLFMQIDEKIFVVQPTLWMQKLLHPVAIEYFMLAYGMFFIYPFFYLIYLLQKNKIEYFQKVMLAEILALIISLSFFIILPTYGPRFILDPTSTNFIQQSLRYSESLQGISIPFLYNLTGYNSLYSIQVDFWNFLERVKTDCFPSLHTCLCLLCLFYAIRFRKIFKHKKLALWFWIVGVISLIFSTVYLRYHWVIDVIAGIVLAVAVYFITEWIFNLWLGFRKKYNIEFKNKFQINI